MSLDAVGWRWMSLDAVGCRWMELDVVVGTVASVEVAANELFSHTIWKFHMPQQMEPGREQRHGWFNHHHFNALQCSQSVRCPSSPMLTELDLDELDLRILVASSVVNCYVEMEIDGHV